MSREIFFLWIYLSKFNWRILRLFSGNLNLILCFLFVFVRMNFWVVKIVSALVLNRLIKIDCRVQNRFLSDIFLFNFVWPLIRDSTRFLYLEIDRIFIFRIWPDFYIQNWAGYLNQKLNQILLSRFWLDFWHLKKI